MPIYEVNGRKANVKDESIDKFLKQYPNAQLVDSTPYYLSRANSTPRESNILKQSDTPVGTNVVTGFVPGFEQGAKALAEGGKIVAGTAANVVTGSSRDAKKALGILEKHANDTDNYNPREAYNQDIQDNYEADMEAYWKQMDEWYKKHPSILGRLKNMLPFVGDIPEEPKNPNLIQPSIGDFGNIIGDNVDMRPYKLVSEALEQGDFEKAKSYLREKAGKKTWGDEVEAEAIKELVTLKPTEGIGAWIGNLTPQMIPNALAIASSLHPATRPFARPLGAAGMGALSASSGGAAMAEARQYTKETGKNIPESDILKAGAIATAIEIGTEYIPFSRYMSRAGSMVKSRIGKEVAQNIINNPTARKEAESLFTKASKTIPSRFTKQGLKEFGKDITAEALSEFSAESLGAIVPMIYADKEDYPTLSEIIENGIEGAKAGLFMGALLGGGSLAVNNYAQNQRRKQQGRITLLDTDNGVVELLGVNGNQYTILNDSGEVADIPSSSVKESRTVGWDEFKQFSTEARKKNISSNTFANLEASEKRIVKQNYEDANKKFDQAFEGTPFIQLKEDLQNATREQQEEFILDVTTSKELTEGQKSAAIDFIIRSNAYASYNQAKESIVDDAVQEVTDIVEENVNPQMDAVVSAVIGGYDNPMQVIGGNIVQNEDGSINRDLSDQSVTIIDAEGKRIPVSIKFVESISENMPTQEAVNQASQIVTKPIIARQENEEVRPYEVGEVVTADAYGNGISFTGEVTGITKDGRYIVVDTQSGRQMTVEPRQIINQDNIQGVEDGSLIEYRNEKGEIAQGVVGSMYALRPQGMIALENGEAVAIEDVIGLAKDTNIENPITGQNADNLQSNIQQNEGAPPIEQSNVSYIERIPQDEKGNLLFDQVPVETTIGALSEAYYDVSELSGVVDATINNIQKQIDKAKTPKPIGDINKDIANKRASNQLLEELSNRLSYWEGVRNSIEQSRPLGQRITEQVTGEEKVPEESVNAEKNNNFVENDQEDEQRNKIPERISQERHGRINEVDREVEERTTDNRGRETPTSEARQIIAGKESKREQLNALESYAKEKGIWIDNTSVLGEQFSEGGENEVFYTPDTNSVFKLNNFEYAGDDVVNFFDRIDAHNTLFPKVHYALIGFAKNSKGETSAVLKQPYVSEADRLATPEEIANFMRSIGLERINEDTYTNNDYEVFDAFSNNVLLGVDGLLYPIDTQIRKNTQEQTIQEKITEAEAETDTNPTEAQKEAGNYKKGKVTIQGFDISIEQPQGSVRSGVDENGKQWSVTMNNTYGYIRKTEGRDGDHIDVFLGDNPDSNKVFVIDQVNPNTGRFDEHKVMLGFNSALSAKRAYLSNYKKGWKGLGNITTVDIETFRKWADADSRRVKPFAEYKEIQEAANTPESESKVQEVVPMDGWENNLMKARKYVKDLMDANLLQPSNELDAVWTNAGKLTSFIKESLENNNIREESTSPAYGASNTLISTEEYEELRKRMRNKLNNLNVGFDPELFTIGTQMAMYHIEAGARKFADFASRMVEDLGSNVRPYLKSFYESARHAPGMETLSKEMDSFNEVNSYDLENLTTFEEESNTSNNSSNETNRDNRSDNSPIDDGRVPAGTSVTDVHEQSGATETENREQSAESPAMEGNNIEQRGQSGRSTGNNADTTGTGLRTTGTETNSDNRRKDTGNTNETGKPLNTNNNRQARGENVVPRGNTAKIKANIAAIKLVKRLIETGKKATPEQMNVLRRYTGWGGLSSVFQINDKNYKALQDLLTEEEYDSARASTTTAFYTPQEITSSVWDMIEKLGFKGGNILEPSAGIGNFFALMPENISNVSNLRGVELDDISGTILKLLYPDAKIDIAGFEKQRIANNSIDLVVSNVPFGNFKVHDTFDKDLSSQFDIHDYFIAKSIRKLKAGGIGVFITTSSTLDKSASLRNWIINNGNADFIDAIRLNTDTFKNDAGTEATADIIIVRKRDTNGRSSFEKNMQDSVVAREVTYMQQEKDKWGYNTGEVEKKARMNYNKYFIDNPQRLSGEMMFGFEGGNAIRPTEQRLAPVKGINQQDVINKMIADLPSNIYNTTPAEQTSKAVANNGTKEGGLTIIDGQPCIVRFDTAMPTDWNSNKVAGYPKTEALQDYLDIKNAIDNLLEAENSIDNEPTHLNKLRNNLNKAYDNFVNKYGTLNENRKINFLQDDVDFSSVSAIENIEDNQRTGEKTISKSDIFSKRVIDKQADPKAENVIDAVRISMNQNGKVDIPYIAQLLDKTNKEVQSEIVNSRIGFVNPESGLVESRNQYLSGNVRDKLSIAQQANQDNEYDTNIEELSKVIPTDIPINLIKMTLGSTWIPERVYNDFFKETFDVNANIRKTSTDKFVSNLSGKGNAKDIQMGMPEAGGSVLALNAMNNTITTISMQVWEDGKRKTVTNPLKTAQAGAKQTELAETFEAWIKQKKEYTEELENIYNNTFNAIVNSKVDVDSFDRFPDVGGKVVRVQSNLTIQDNVEVKQFRVAKENTEADNNSVLDLAKKLDISYDKKNGLFSTDSSLKAAQFEKEANGTAKILRQHQKEGVIRGLEGATLLAHEVGTGKTLTLITTAMEMRRLGLAKKPAIVVQRSTYKQFVKEIKNQYPNAKVLAPSSKDLSTKQRQQLFAKIAYNDWDIVVLYHSYLDSIPDDPGRVAQYIDERIAEKMDLLEEMERAKDDGATNAGRMIGSLKKEIQRLERERDNTLNPETEEEDEAEGKSKRKRSVKDIEKVRANTEAKLERSLDRRTDNTMTFEQFGIDALLVDEAHAYKKLGFVTSLQRVKGIDTAESKRAQSTRLKSSYILENHNGKNVVFATGTPISNTMAEMWTFLRYLLPRTEMSRLQMNNFDAFVNNFGSIEESAEFGSNGKFRVTNRFSSYSNVPELISAWRQVAHTVLTEEVSTLREGVGTPRVEGGKPTDVMLEQTAPLKSVMKAIKNKLEWFDRLSGKEKKEFSYIPLVMFGLAKRAAIDVRLVDPNLPDDVNSKTNIAVRNILQDLRDTASYKGSIAVFCDSYQSSDKTFNVFKDIKQKLIDNGIPAEQIAIINDYEKDEAKEKLFAAVNNGDIRVVMGTTEKLGVGVNIQERLHMAGHLDAPLRPSDYQQRNGRIIRQGNTHLNMDKTVKIMRWGVKKTLDVTGYQRLEIKKKFIDQIMKGDVSQRMLEEADIESTDSANFNQMMANLSGSQAALALSIEQNKLKKLQNARQYHEDNQVYMAGAVRRAKGIIVGNGQAIERFEDYKKELNKLFPKGKVTTVSIGKVSANTPEDIDILLSKNITKKIDKEAADLREDFLRENAIIKTSMDVNGIKIDLEIEVKRNYDVDTRKTRITRNIHYITPNNSINNPSNNKNEVISLFESNAGANVQNVIEHINDLLSGYDIDREIQKYKLGIDKSKRDIEAYEPQIGQPFAKEKELKATEEKVEELNAQMEVELKQIEEEEAKEDVEAIDIDDIVEKNTEDNPEDDPTPPTGGRRQTASSGTFDIISAKKFNSLIDTLNQTGLAADVIIEEDINGTQTVRDKKGNVYGYVTPEGVVHLDAQNMNANTPIHEFGHLWSSFIKSKDSALYNRGIELIMQSPYWERVNNNSDYEQLSESEKADEAIAMAIGDKGEAITNRDLKQRFIDWLSDLWQSVKQVFGINTSIAVEDMILSDFTDRAVQDLLSGKRLTDTSASLDNIQLQSVNDLANANNSAMTEDVRNQLDRELKQFRNRLREQWEDRHLPVKIFLDTLRKNGTEVREHDDYYKRATHINGSIDAQLEHYNEAYQRPLNKAISNLEKAGFDYRAIENYTILKHGLERNAWMREDAINQYKLNNPEATQEQIDKFAEKLPDDYSGITAVQEEIGMSAENFISEFENKAGNKLINDLWQKIKAATTYSLQKQKEGGLINKKTFDELTSRYEYYIPLRGHDAEVAEDRWDYSPNMGTYFVAPLIKAKGRKTRSESPFAYIFSMAQSSINSANRNLLNQTILRLAMMDKTKLLGVNKVWYVQSGLNEKGKPVYEVQSPTYSENPEQYEKNITEFEERMQKMAEAGLAVQSGSKLDIGGLFIKRNQAEQHEVHIYQNGTEYVVYINANPAVARAITGANAKDLHKDLRFIARISRQMAANFTTRNPIFVLSNFSRDYIFASSILPVKEDAKYAIQFQRNMLKSAGALQRYIRGKADLTKQQDRYVIEYIMNGAKTGFSHIVELQKIQKQIEREIKKGDNKSVFRHTLDALESCNEFAENLSRLSVYITSREQGRSIVQSVSDAKKVTVNFNRNGAGGWGAAWFRSLYLFVNAGIQALSNFVKVAQKNKGKIALLISSYAMSGFLMPMLAALIGGDDGLDEYMKLSDWERQNNLCLYTGNGFIKIPLPHELRVFHAMGDNIYQASFGKKDVTESILDVILGFSDLIPANPMGSIQGSWADIMPDATKPFFQLAANKNFTGSQITKENQDKDKPGYLKIRTNKKGQPYAPAFLVKLGESLDSATGGDGVEKGLISFNPDEVNHILRGYFGGLYGLGMNVLSIGSKTVDTMESGEIKVKATDFIPNAFYKSADDLLATSSGLNSKYFKIADDIQETRRKIKGYQEQATKGQIGVDKFAEKIQGMANDVEKYKRIYPLMKQIKKYETALKELDSDHQKEAEKIISNLKKEVIEINSIMGK